MRHFWTLCVLIAGAIASENGISESATGLGRPFAPPVQPPPACTNCGLFTGGWAQCGNQDRCPCFNEFYLKCWKKNQDRCEIPIQQCFSPDGRTPALPVPLNSEFPPCGRRLPDCPQYMSCRTIRKLCIDVDRTGDCVGVCLPRTDYWLQQSQPNMGPMQQPPFWGGQPQATAQPPFWGGQPQATAQPPFWGGQLQPSAQPPAQPAAQPPVQPQAPAVQPAPAPVGPPRTYEPKPGNSLCPTNMRCPREDDLCVPDPRNPGVTPVYLCGYPDQYCGGNNMKACPAGNICVKDPRDACNPADGDPKCQGICL